MRTAIVIIILILSNDGFASNSCFFSDSTVREAIKVASEIEECFTDSDRSCFINEKNLEDQMDLNSLRLVPKDRNEDGGFMDRATGVVSVEFGKYAGNDSEKTFSASTQKISRCHVITSAHLLYADGDFPLESENFKLKFRSGQSCDINRPFKNADVDAKVFFKMANKEKNDFKCKSGVRGEPCQLRLFRGHSDLMILKLSKTSKDRDYFTLDTRNPSEHKLGQRVDCFAYPGANENINIPTDKVKMFMFSQKGAQIFGDKGGESEKGVLTNALAYKGMSGGGCVIPDKPRVLVGMFANDNKSTGKPVVDITRDRNFSQNQNYKTANFLSAFHDLSVRYFAETGKKLQDLDKECD